MNLLPDIGSKNKNAYMRYLLKLVLGVCMAATMFTACEKVGDLPYANNGSPVVVSASTTTIAAVPADSNKIALTLNWTSPNYGTAEANYKYVIEIDSSGRNFSKEYTRIVTGLNGSSLNNTFTAKDLNNIMLGYGFSFGVAYNMDVRITSSYGNNNEQLVSNVLKIKMTPYVVPPKVVPPTSKALFLVGSASAGGWNNGPTPPLPIPAQQFTRLDSVTYQGTFFLNGGNEYLLLPVRGDWTHKFSVANKALAGLSAGGSFGLDLSDNIPGPAKTGMYKITVDFQHGTFSVAQVSLYGLLYVPGDYQGWTPASAPPIGSPKADGNFDGYLNMPSGGTYQFKLTTTPDWNNAIGDGGSGTLVPGGGGNLSVPGAGYYHLVANTVNNTWSATLINQISLIGSFAASGWSNDVDMVYSSSSNTWTGTIVTAAGDQFKFRINHDWGLNYGESGGKGSLSPGGDNIGDAGKNFAVPAGTHKITLYMGNPGYYTYSID